MLAFVLRWEFCMITEIIHKMFDLWCFFIQCWLGIKLRRNISLAEHEIGFGYAAIYTEHTITQACRLVAVLSKTQEDNKVYYMTFSLLFYLEKITVGVFRSSAAGYKYNYRPFFLLTAPNDKHKNIYTFNSKGPHFFYWPEWNEKALHK